MAADLRFWKCWARLRHLGVGRLERGGDRHCSVRHRDGHGIGARLRRRRRDTRDADADREKQQQRVETHHRRSRPEKYRARQTSRLGGPRAVPVPTKSDTGFFRHGAQRISFGQQLKIPPSPRSHPTDACANVSEGGKAAGWWGRHLLVAYTAARSFRSGACQKEHEQCLSRMCTDQRKSGGNAHPPLSEWTIRVLERAGTWEKRHACPHRSPTTGR